MKLRLKTISAGVAALLMGLSAPVSNAETPPIGATANWAIHFDVADFRQTTLGAAIEKRARSPEEERAITLGVDVLGFDLRRDLHALTVYGPDKDLRTAVVIAQGNFDAERVRTFLGNRASYSEQMHGEHRILQWGEGGKGAILFREPGAMAFHPSGVAVLAASPVTVGQALDLLDGKAEGREIATPADSGTPYLLAFADLAALGEFHPTAALLRQSEHFLFAVGQTDNDLTIRATVAARDDESARQMEAVIHGLQAYALLRSTGDWAVLPDWLLTATIVRDGNVLEFFLDAPAGRVEEFLRHHSKNK